MNILDEISKKYKLTDKGSIKADGNAGHNYTEVYHEYFNKYIGHNVSILEIGFGGGDSLKMWEEYFQNAKITCIDNDLSRIETYGYNQSENINVKHAEQGSAPSIKEALGDTQFDIIIDDGSHICDHIKTSFNYLFKNNLKDNGIYCVEDTYNSYVPMRHDGSSVNYFKGLVDNLYEGVDRTQETFKDDFNIQTIHFYRQMVIIKKSTNKITN